MAFSDITYSKKMNELKDFSVEETHKTPLIDFNHITGELIISGKSIPENPAKIYEPVMEWVSIYITNPRPVTNLRFNVEYFNTTSSIWFSKIIKALTQINNPDYLLIVHLYVPLEEYDDLNEIDDIRDAFGPITNLFQNTIPGVGLKLYGTNDNSEVVKDTMVLM